MTPSFVYCRDRPGSGKVRDDITEEHWAFMDDYADRMIARGPTCTVDMRRVTGSLHIVDFPDGEAAQTFAREEPYYRAGVFAEVVTYAWRDLLGRTMWEFSGDPQSPRYLVIALGADGVPGADEAFASKNGGRLIVYGQLSSGDGPRTGLGFTVEAGSRNDVETLMGAHPDRFESIEIHLWHFGGRPIGWARPHRAAHG